MHCWLIRANLHPSLDSKVAATIAVPSIDPRGLVVSLAACVPTFLAFWLVYRHGTLQMLAAFGSRHQSHQSNGGYWKKSVELSCTASFQGWPLLVALTGRPSTYMRLSSSGLRRLHAYRGGNVWNGTAFQAFCGTERRPSKMGDFVIKKTMAFCLVPPHPLQQCCKTPN